MDTQIKQWNKEGLTNREIARRLGINHKTVSEHLRKMGLSSKWAKQPIIKVSKNKAQCSRCSGIFPLSHFQYGRKGQNYEYRFSYCNECRKKQCYLNLNKSLEAFMGYRYSSLKTRCKSKKIVLDITKDYLIDLYRRQEGKCFYTDTPMVYVVGEGKSRNTLSIDKIDPTKGYIKGNVVLCTNRVNSIKNDVTLEEMKLWMPDWYSRVVDMWRACGMTCLQVDYGNF